MFEFHSMTVEVHPLKPLGSSVLWFRENFSRAMPRSEAADSSSDGDHDSVWRSAILAALVGMMRDHRLIRHLTQPPWPQSETSWNRIERFT